MSIEEVRAKLQQAEHYRLLANDPSLSLRAALAAHNLHRSYRAAAKLARKALEYELAKAQAAFEATMKQRRSRHPPT